jgi:hypothetical protein
MEKTMKNLALAFAFILCSSAAFAAENSLRTNIDKVDKSTSAYNRKDKSFYLLATPMGIGPSMTPESSAGVGAMLNSRMALQFEIGGGESGNFMPLADSEGSSKARSLSSSASFKYFLGNSFYLKSGIDYRRMNYDYSSTGGTLYTTNGYTNYTYNFEGDSWAASLVIGNQWQWKTFTMGCDWFGVTAPFASNVSSENINIQTATTKDIVGDMRDKESRYLKDVAFQALRFYVGASF